jgi:hypothetical protein
VKNRISVLVFFYAALVTSAVASSSDQKLIDACEGLRSANRINQSAESCVDDVNAGISPTQTIVGVYFLAKGDYKSAEQLFRKGANVGDPVAQNGLGYLYQFGYGVEKNRTTANSYFLKSAEQGNTDSQFWLGENLVLAQDYANGFLWTEKAARGGSVDAQFNLGILYNQGQGTKKDIRFMYFWFTVAALNGHEKAKQTINNMNAKLPKDVASELNAFVKTQLGSCPKCIKN